MDLKIDILRFSSIMYTRGQSQRKGAGAERISEGPSARKDCEGRRIGRGVESSGSGSRERCG